MPTSLWAIADKARVSKQHRFGGLARLLTPGNLKRSFGLLKKKAAPGVDKVTWQEYQRDLDANVEGLGERLNGKAVVKRRTARKKLRASVASFTEWIKEKRHSSTPTIMKTLAAKLRGHWNYYGVIGNQASQWEFFRQITGILFKWLNRRSQRTSYTWAGLRELFKQYAVPQPCITERTNG